MSFNIKRGWSLGSYGVYATNSRLFGVKGQSGKGAFAGAVVGAALGGALGSVIGLKIGEKLSRDDTVKALQELEQRKDFEAKREEITGISLKKGSVFSAGELVVQTVGAEYKLKFNGKREFEELRALFQAFSPANLNVKE